ncbi:hypothetical protein [Amycolatopsis sp. NPDC054798]
MPAVFEVLPRGARARSGGAGGAQVGEPRGTGFRGEQFRAVRHAREPA